MQDRVGPLRRRVAQRNDGEGAPEQIFGEPHAARGLDNTGVRQPRVRQLGHREALRRHLRCERVRAAGQLSCHAAIIDRPTYSLRCKLVLLVLMYDTWEIAARLGTRVVCTASHD